jgi:hypothetical protein
MNINLTILFWALPSFITLGVMRAGKRPTKESFSLLGWRRSALRHYLVGVVLALVIGGLTGLTFWLFARDLLLHKASGTRQMVGTSSGLVRFRRIGTSLSVNLADQSISLSVDQFITS